jgi:hypothetical protein
VLTLLCARYAVVSDEVVRYYWRYCFTSWCEPRRARVEACGLRIITLSTYVHMRCYIVAYIAALSMIAEVTLREQHGQHQQQQRTKHSSKSTLSISSLRQVPYNATVRSRV